MIPRLRIPAALLAISLFVHALSGCDSDTGKAKTQVLVRVDSDMREELASIDVQILDARADELGSSYSFDLEEHALPLSFAVAPPANKVTGSFLAVVRGKGKSGALLAEAKGLFSFATGRTLGVSLWLLKSCRGVICAELETCDATDPNAPSCAPVAPLETRDAKDDDTFDDTFTEPVTGPPLTVPSSPSDEPGNSSSGSARDAGNGADSSRDASASDAGTSTSSDASTSTVTMDAGATDAGTTTMDGGNSSTDSGPATRDANVDAGPAPAVWDQFNWDQALWQ